MAGKCGENGREMAMADSTGTSTFDASAENQLAGMARLLGGESIEREVQALRGQSPALDALLTRTDEERIAAGYGHTLREITQQPLAWADTVLRTLAFAGVSLEDGPGGQRFRAIALTGSGSSEYAAELAAPAIEARVGVPVRAVPCGDFLAYGAAAMGPEAGLLISLARSGNSPESAAAIRVVMRERPDTRFLHVTCNARGQLALHAAGDDRVSCLLLHPRTHDESLVMTSSYTSMALALTGLFRQAGENGTALPSGYLRAAAQLCEGVRARMARTAAAMADLPFARMQRAVFLGSGCQRGAAREAALKLTEMTAGRIVSMHETFLGLRHGPMAALDDTTLVVALLPVAEQPRRYAVDLLAELHRKGLGVRTLVVDGGVRSDELDATAPHGSVGAMPEEFAALEGVVAGQWLGFFACLHHGLQPDAPAATGVITRVVQPFPIYA